jgi:hypothetical protein
MPERAFFHARFTAIMTEPERSIRSSRLDNERVAAPVFHPPSRGRRRKQSTGKTYTMTNRALLTAMLLGSAIAGTRLMAQVPEPQAAGQCTAATQDAIKAQAKKRAVFGFARSLAGNLPMVGHSVGAAVAGQATVAALDGAASVSAAQTPRCPG